MSSRNSQEKEMEHPMFQAIYIILPIFLAEEMGKKNQKQNTYAGSNNVFVRT